MSINKFDGGAVIVKYKRPGGDVAIPARIGWKAVVGIGDAAFSGKGLTSVVIPDSVTSVLSDAGFTVAKIYKREV